MNPTDPLDNLAAQPGTASDLPPAPKQVEFDFPLVSQRSEDDLAGFGINMVEDYRDFKEEFVNWLGSFGKNPEKGEGLADSTLKSTHYKLETVFRWLWDYEETYTTDFTPEHADRFIHLLDQSDGMIDSGVLYHVKAIKRLFKYTNHVERTDYDWDPDIELSQAMATSATTSAGLRSSRFSRPHSATARGNSRR